MGRKCPTPPTRNAFESHQLVGLNFNQIYFAAILIVGGVNSEKSVEALRSDGTPLCKMPDLPDNRAQHTLDGDILCGGYYTRTSCLHYGSEGWTKYGWNLQQKRSEHLSWRKPDDSLQIMGGIHSPKTSEIVTSGGSRIGFDLKYKTM